MYVYDKAAKDRMGWGQTRVSDHNATNYCNNHNCMLYMSHKMDALGASCSYRNNKYQFFIYLKIMDKNIAALINAALYLIYILLRSYNIRTQKIFSGGH